MTDLDSCCLTIRGWPKIELEQNRRIKKPQNIKEKGHIINSLINSQFWSTTLANEKLKLFFMIKQGKKS